VIPFGERHLRRTLAEFVDHTIASAITRASAMNSSTASDRSGPLVGFAVASVSAGSSTTTTAPRKVPPRRFERSA
jgi:hypothetical protein